MSLAFYQLNYLGSKADVFLLFSKAYKPYQVGVKFLNHLAFSNLVYSRVDIIKAVKRGKIYIENFNESNLQPNSYKLHLDDEFAIAKRGKVDPLETSDFSGFYERKKGDYFHLKPSMFVLARSEEKIALSKYVGALVNGRTTLARLGISLTQTAPIIQSGHGVPRPRKVIFEIFNAGPLEVTLRSGMVISEICFFELDTPTNKLYDSFGRYGIRPNKDELLPVKD